MTSTLNNRNLQEIIQKSTTVANMSSSEITEYKIYLNRHLRDVWCALGKNSFTDTGIWLLHCRAAVMGFLCMFESSEEFCEEIYNICSHNEDILDIKKLNISLFIDCTETFQLSVIYGLNHCAQIYKNKFHLKLDQLFNIIMENCKRETRFTHYYLKMLIPNVENGLRSQLSLDEYYKNIFETIYHNLENKDVGILFSKILNKSALLQGSFLLEAANTHMSWKNKQKFVLFNLILTYDKRLVSTLQSKDIVAGLIYAQSNPYLTSYGSKLHNAIIEHIPPLLWLEEYFAEFQNIIAAPGQPTFCHKNILKNYMPSDNKFADLYLEHIIDIYSKLPEPPLFTILSLTLIGVKNGLFQDSYNYNNIIDLAWNTRYEQNRVLLFEILCFILEIHRVDTYNLMQKFLIYNINEVQAASRDSMKKSFSYFLKRIENIVMKRRNITDFKSVIQHSSDFLNWLITFLLDQFNSLSNYARITTSFTLLTTVLNSLLIDGTCQDAQFMENLINYRKLINISQCDTFDKFLNILEVTDEDSKNTIISLIVKHANFVSMSTSKKVKLEVKAYKYICNTNKDIAERGKKIIELLLRMEIQESLQVKKIKSMLYMQWICLKNNKNEDVIVSNPLHPLLSLINTAISKYTVTERLDIYDIIEDIINNLTRVFESRTMHPFIKRHCIGLRNVFKNENSEFHACSVNCMWLALKECCKLVTTILNTIKTKELMHRSLNILYTMIRSCYHKGVLEEAARTIEEIVASATKNLYGESGIDEFVNHIFKIIPTIKYVSSTVRKAGETRLVLTSIACNDNRYNKPLLHKIVKYLMDTLNACIYGTNDKILIPHIAHSLTLHCLETIIINKSVELHTSGYLAELALLTLISFESNNWRIRNAALQTFSAITKRIAGASISSNENALQNHVVCYEEIFFKYPAIFEHIEEKMKEVITNQQMENLIPMLTFLSLIDTRPDVLMLKERGTLNQLSLKIIGLITITTNVNIFNVAAKAFTALCAHDKIESEIDNFSKQIQDTNDNNINFALISVIKCLFLKLLDSVECVYNGKCSKTNILNKMESFISDTSAKGFFLKAISSILLYRSDFTLIQSSEIIHIIKCVYLDMDKTLNFPGLWEHTISVIYMLIDENGIETAVNMCLTCIELNLPMDSNTNALKILEKRISQRKDEREYCSKYLSTTMSNLILSQNYKDYKFFVEQCIKILLCTGINNIELNIQQQLIDQIYDFPVYFFPLFCLIWENYYFKENEMQIFYTKCITNCLLTLTLENPDVLLLKSTKYIYKYGVAKSDNEMIYKSLKILYKMLQRNEEDIKEECQIMSVNYLGFKNMHNYALMMQLLDKDTLTGFLNVFYTLIFLIEIYCERSEKTLTMNVFQQQQVLCIETHIVRHIIFKNIMDMINNLSDHTEFKIWFCDYVQRNLHNEYLQELKEFFVLINKNLVELNNALVSTVTD